MGVPRFGFAGSRSRHCPDWDSAGEDLLGTRLVVEAGTAGNSPLYGLADDDERVEVLRALNDLTGAALRRERDA